MGVEPSASGDAVVELMRFPSVECALMTGPAALGRKRDHRAWLAAPGSSSRSSNAAC
jgi:hypothetical protein